MKGRGKRSRANGLVGIAQYSVRMAKVKMAAILCIPVICLSSSVPAIAQSQQTPTPSVQTPAPVQPGSISGTVVDPDGALVANVKVSMAQEGLASQRVALSDGDGHFIFTDVTPGAFHLSLTAPGFATLETSGVLHAGEELGVPQLTLGVARASVDVEVTLPPEQVAEDEVKIEEKQRVLGFIPNFYVTYIPHAAPLTTKLKFQLAWRSTIDPVSFAITGAVAGFEQAENEFSGYGQGAKGYARRYGAAYGDLVSATFIGGAILPSLLKQDPRYFYKGTGTRQSRFWYAIANAVICKGDNGRWQPNYSGIIGGLAAGGISNLYYPAENRNGASLTFENALIGIGAGAASNVIQEFIVRKFTPHLTSATDPAKP